MNEQQAAWFGESFNQILRNIEQIFRGKTEVIRTVLVALFSEGHVLLEDVPGTGKTSLAKALANSIQGSWNRIQFTPDLLPSDVTGVMIFNQSNGKFEFHPGPIFANIVLADEINRASPKTQSALLEVMEEQQVTVDVQAYPAPRPFSVLATQNPIEQDGTYRLPEAQLDRFLIRTSIGYLDHQHEVEVIESGGAAAHMAELKPVTTPSHVQGMIQVAGSVHVPNSIAQYVARLSATSRSISEIQLGMSTRAGLALVKAARAFAASHGRPYVTTDDVKRMAPPVLNHRLMLTPEAELKGRSAMELTHRIVEETEPPPIERAS